jgi:hypothetical protein
MKIANIVYEGDLVNHKKLDYVNYYNYPIKYDDLNQNLPTIYVGWSFMRNVNKGNELFDNADILKHRIITNKLYWEFSFDESKSSHVSGVKSFVNYIPKFYFSKYTYIDLDPVFFQISNTQDLGDVLPKQIDFVLFAKGDMIYTIKENKITGINMEMYGYFDFDKSEIRDLLLQRSVNYCDDNDGTMLIKYSKTFPNFPNLKRYLIVLLTN